MFQKFAISANAVPLKPGCAQESPGELLRCGFPDSNPKEADLGCGHGFAFLPSLQVLLLVVWHLTLSIIALKKSTMGKWGHQTSPFPGSWAQYTEVLVDSCWTNHSVSEPSTFKVSCCHCEASLCWLQHFSQAQHSGEFFKAFTWRASFPYGNVTLSRTSGCSGRFQWRACKLRHLSSFYTLCLLFAPQTHYSTCSTLPALNNGFPYPLIRVAPIEATGRRSEGGQWMRLVSYPPFLPAMRVGCAVTMYQLLSGGPLFIASQHELQSLSNPQLFRTTSSSLPTTTSPGCCTASQPFL